MQSTGITTFFIYCYYLIISELLDFLKQYLKEFFALKPLNPIYVAVFGTPIHAG